MRIHAPHPATTASRTSSPRPSGKLACSVLLAAVVLAGCSDAAPTAPAGQSAPSTPTDVTSSTSTLAPPTTAAPRSGADASPAQDGVEGTVVRFSAGGTAVDVTIGEDTPTTRDFVALLPFTMQLEEYAGREKIGDPPRELDVQGSPGSDPQDGDLIYFTPWGDLGFYYDASGIGYSDATPHLGTYQASEEQLSRWEGKEVTVEVIS